MNSDLALIITTTLAELEEQTKGKAFFSIEENTCLGGIIVRGIEYNEDSVIEKLSKMHIKLGLRSLNHLSVGKNIITFYLDVRENRLTEEELEELEFEEF
ncbi:hypothetical protein VSU16_15075 (plasmid) [Cetobacterium somerae]|uniref:hypothetical protein n=1 Tax=Cetobacterium somerae TaxID=188913 RepID=UPI002E7AFCA8|nr:hypothetical protein [Cetobacterium somerae]WVJ03051.1 hypothetical protein VSU16_15075 [Cetobacterium somerae]